MIGNIIVVNGGSSVGKTTLCRALQRTLSEPHLLSGGDIFFLERPPFYLDYVDDGRVSSESGLVAYFVNEELAEVHIGPLALKWNEEMFHALASWADRGNHVIVDTVLHSPELAAGMQRGLGDRSVFHVGVTCPLDEAQRREIERGNRALGAAVYFHSLAHGHYDYDLAIDTAALSTQAAVAQIREELTIRDFVS